MRQVYLEARISRGRSGSPRLRASISLWEPGTILGLTGVSGSGKSSLLRMISGLSSPDEGLLRVGGEVWYDSREGIDLLPEERSVAYFSQAPCLFSHMSAGENLSFATEMAEGVTGRSFRRTFLGAAKWVRRLGRSCPLSTEALRLASLFGISPLLEKNVETLSGGEYRKVALARLFLKKTRLYLLDEPLSGIDREERSRLRPIIAGLLREGGASAIWVTHSPDELLPFVASMGGIVRSDQSGELAFLSAIAPLIPERTHSS